eukprot:scaffold100618_cov72-Cyclotella_meneghiniana.AAC.2
MTLMTRTVSLAVIWNECRHYRTVGGRASLASSQVRFSPFSTVMADGRQPSTVNRTRRSTPINAT